MNSKLVCILVAIGMLVAVETSQADVTYGRWKGNSCQMSASELSFPYKSAYRRALGTITSRFNLNPSEFSISQLYGDLVVRLENNQNEVWFSNDPEIDPAWTFWSVDADGYIKEADVVFFSGAPYTASMSKLDSWAYGGAYLTFETTAMHEYGHVAGLDHEATEYNIMGLDWTHVHCNGSRLRSYLGEDACHGLIKLYGSYSSGNRQDVSVSLFKWTGSITASNGDLYSVHDKCKMYFSTSDNELDYTNFEGQRRYNVSIGQQAKVEFTWENNGETPKKPNVGWYISTDSTITTSDTLFETTSLPRLYIGHTDTLLTTITIPTNLTSGTTYYLGAIIDYDNKINETDENNNAAYHIIRVNY